MRALAFVGVAVAAGLGILVWGCASIEKGYPDQHYYVLEVKAAANPGSGPGSGVLEVAEARISPRYAEKSFVYRISENRYESDFYNRFLVAPATLITEELRKGLERSHVFRHVIGPAHQLRATHVLEPAVSALYGDFRDPDAPKAVLEMEVFLTAAGEGGQHIVMDRRFRRSVAVSRRSPEALVQGWNRALEEVVAALSAELKAIHLK